MRATCYLIVLFLTNLSGFAQPNLELPVTTQVLLTKQIISTTLIANVSTQLGYIQNIPEDDRKEFLNWIDDKIMKGELTAYKHPEGIPTKEKQYALSIEAYIYIKLPTDTMYIEDAKTKEMVPEPFSVQMYPNHVSKIDCLESWEYDTNNATVKKKVLAIGPGREDIDEITGEYKGFKNMFWVWLEE